MPFHQYLSLTSANVRWIPVWPLVGSSWHVANTFCLMDVDTTSFRCPWSSYTNNPWGVWAYPGILFGCFFNCCSVACIAGSFVYGSFHSWISSIRTIEDLVITASSCVALPSVLAIFDYVSSFLLLLDSASASILAFPGWYLIVGCIDWKNPKRIHLVCTRDRTYCYMRRVRGWWSVITVTPPGHPSK